MDARFAGAAKQSSMIAVFGWFKPIAVLSACW
jgi:hypothetical protein